MRKGKELVLLGAQPVVITPEMTNYFNGPKPASPDVRCLALVPTHHVVKSGWEIWSSDRYLRWNDSRWFPAVKDKSKPVNMLPV